MPTVRCYTCEIEIQRSEWKLKRNKRHFCSIACRGKWQSTRTGKDDPRYKRIEIPCAACGTILERIPSYVRDYKNTFCDQRCRGKWLSQNLKAENHPNWNSIRVMCEHCGRLFYRQPNQVASSGRQFCDKTCYDEWQKATGVISGENNPRWNGGLTALVYGPNWDKQREKARKRDNYTCRDCGITQKEYGQNLDVHHIIPFRFFGLERYKEANQLSNLISLCRSCHRKMEDGQVD